MRDLAAEYQRLLRGTHAKENENNVHFYVYSTSLEEGRGDVFVALGLARALDALGWGVSFADHEGWVDPVSEHTTVSISMLPTAAPPDVDREVLRLGWARNAVDEWCAQPHLQKFDGMLASSATALKALNVVYLGPSEVMPIAVDPDLFLYDEGARDLPIVTTVNYWGHDRGLIRALGRIHTPHEVHWFGTNLEQLEAAAPGVTLHGAVSYLEVPALYRRARVVLDDLTTLSRKHECHNSRLFEGLASGALVVTNLRGGLDELGLSDVPVADEADTLADVLDRYLLDEAGRSSLSARLRDVVLTRHTFGQRASALIEFISSAQAAANYRRALVSEFYKVKKLAEENSQLDLAVEVAHMEIRMFRARRSVKIFDAAEKVKSRLLESLRITSS